MVVTESVQHEAAAPQVLISDDLSAEYIVPSPLDSRVGAAVASAVAVAAEI
jgi:malate dehydrogenase (oxaloacetate-decarboxylating)